MGRGGVSDSVLCIPFYGALSSSLGDFVLWAWGVRRWWEIGGLGDQEGRG